MMGEFQVIQLEGLALALYLPIIRLVSSAKVIMRAHNAEFRIWERNAAQSKPGIRKIYFSNLAKRLKDFERKSLDDCDAVAPISQTDEQTFKNLGVNSQLHVAPFGIDGSYFTNEQESTGDPTIFFLGSLDWIPNQEGLTWFIEEVWEQIRFTQPDLIFRVAGRNAPGSIQKKMARHGIMFLGEVDNAIDFIVSNAVMIVPLFAGSGIRVKIIEAMALGRVIITTTIGAEGIGGESGIHYIIADNPDQFIKEIKRIVHDPENLTQIGRNARKFVMENFDNLVISQDISRFYNSLVK